jgi:hypothetical protein
VAQIALWLALLTAAALFIRGAIKAVSVDTGLGLVSSKHPVKMKCSLTQSKRGAPTSR